MNQPIISNRWVQVAIAVIVIGLLYIIFFQGCGKNKHVDDKYRVDSIIVTENKRNVKDSIAVAEYKAANDTLAKIAAIQKQKIEVLERQLDISGNRANKLAVAVANAKIVHDTVAYVNNCDSLGLSVIDLTNIIDRYQAENKQLVTAMDFQIVYKDSVIAITEAGRAELYKSFNAIGGKYDILYSDYSKLVKKKRRATLLNKVLAVSLLVAGGVILAK